MKGIILAAGRGSRMSGLTRNQPKCLVQLAGKPLLFWQLEAMNRAGINEQTVVCGYRAEDIAGMESTAPAPFQILMNDNWATTNMFSTLLCAAGWANREECIVSYSDIVYSSAHVAALMAAREPFAITYDFHWKELWEIRQDNPLHDAETFREEGGRLLEIGGKPQSLDEIHGQYMGLFKINPAGWDILDSIYRSRSIKFDSIDMTGFFRKMLEDNVAIGAVRVNGKWCEVDCEKDLLAYENIIHMSGWSHDWRG